MISEPTTFNSPHGQRDDETREECPECGAFLASEEWDEHIDSHLEQCDECGDSFLPSEEPEHKAEHRDDARRRRDAYEAAMEDREDERRQARG